MKNKPYWLARGLLLAMVLFIQTPSHAAENAIMKVIVNQEEKGDVFLLVTPTGDVLLSPDDLKELGFSEAPTGIRMEQDSYVSLASLAPGVRFSIDEKTSSLHIVADPRLLKKTLIDFAYRQPRNAAYIQDSAGFLNYGFYWSGSDNSDDSSFTAPLELGINVDGVFGYSSFSYARTPMEETFVRLFSHVTMDSPENNRRLVLGDFAAAAGPLGGAGIFGGVSVSRNFSTTPYFLPFPGLNASGILHAPAEAQIYINDAFVRSERLSPGEFELLNLSTVANVGDMTLVIRDASGREQKIVQPFHIATSLLKPGLQDYSYNFGYRRVGLGQDSSVYEDPAFLATHRVGITQSLTAGLGAEADHDIFSIGPSTTFLLPWASQIDAAFAFSSERGNQGLGGFLNYAYVGRKFSAGGSIRSLSRDYSNLALQNIFDKPKLHKTASAAFSHGPVGTVSLSFSQTETQAGRKNQAATVYYSRTLSKNIFSYLSLNQSRAEQTSHGIFAGLNFNLDQRRNATVSYQSQDRVGVSTLALQQSPASEIGPGYRLYASRRQDDSQNVDGGGSFQYKGRHGLYSAAYRQGAGRNSYLLGTAGGIAVIDRAAYFTRPISDGFALVSVENLEGVKVYRSNQWVGTTDARGTVLVPNLISYYDNKISIDDRDIPIDYTVPQVERYVTLPYRGGGIVKFAATKLKSFSGRFFFMAKGRKQSADFAGLEIKIGEKTIETVVGRGGEFYLENLPAGRFPARAFLNGKECAFDLTIPDSDASTIDLGELSCEVA